MCFGMVTHHRPAIMDAVLATMLALGRAIFVIFLFQQLQPSVSIKGKGLDFVFFVPHHLSVSCIFFIVPKKGDSSCLSSADVSQLQPSVSIKGKGLELCLFCAIIIFSLFYASLFQKGDVQLFISRQPTSAQNKKEFCRRQLFFSFYFYLCPSPHSVPPTHKHPTSP